MAALRTRPLAPRRRVRSRSTNTAARDGGAPWPEPLPLWTWVFGDRAVTMAQTISPVHRGDGRRDRRHRGPDAAKGPEGDPVPLHRLDRIGGGRPVPVVSGDHCE